MRLRNIGIIVCNCGAELNPEITTPQDFIKYNADTKTAICTQCGASGVIEFPQPPVYEPPIDLEATVTDLIQLLADKGVIY